MVDLSIVNDKQDYQLDIVIDQFYDDSIVIRDINGNGILRLYVNIDDNLAVSVKDMYTNKRHVVEICGMEK